MCEEPDKLSHTVAHRQAGPSAKKKEKMTAVEWNSSLRRFTCENEVELHLHVVQLAALFDPNPDRSPPNSGLDVRLWMSLGAKGLRFFMTKIILYVIPPLTSSSVCKHSARAFSIT